jgi:PKD repeat protein
MKGLLSFAILVAAVALAGCTVHQTEAPGLSGPSGLALSVRVAALPDSISQDGGSQSSIQVTAIGPDGQPKNGVPVRVDMFVNGVGQDYGTLSARSLVTNSSGVANVVYTAPPPPTAGIFGTCKGLPGNCVEIVATPSGLGFETANPESVMIRLVPPGVILPPASTPTASFTITPTPVQMNVRSTFDASASVPGQGASSITSYAWSFGDGGTASGKTVTNSYATTGTFTVSLTVTNDRGLSATSVQTVAVGASNAPTAQFVASQTAPVIGQTVFFNGDASRAAPGHSITQWSWDFGDGTGSSAAISTSHSYAVSGTYVVVLTVKDDTDQKGTSSATLTVGSGNPVPSFTLSPSTPKVGDDVTFDASGTQVFGGAQIVSYQWNFGDGTTSTNGPVANHVFGSAATRTVSLTVIDSVGRRGTTSVSVTISP